MAGYKKDVEYDWYIDLGSTYAKFKATAKKAHEVLDHLRELIGEGVTMKCLNETTA